MQQEDLLGALGAKRTASEWSRVMNVPGRRPSAEAATDPTLFYEALAWAQDVYAGSADALRVCLEVQAALYATTERRAITQGGDATQVYGGQDGMLIAGAIGGGKSRALALIKTALPMPYTHPATSTYRGSWTQVPVVAITCPDGASKVDLYDEAVREMAPMIGLELTKNRLYTRHRGNDLYHLFAGMAREHALGLFIVDEIQNIEAQKSGGADSIKNNLVRLAQQTGVSLILIGTPPALKLVASSARTARRLAERYIPWDPPERLSPSWERIAQALWDSRVLGREMPFTEGVRDALWDASQGVPSFAQTLLGDEQRAAFLGKEIVLDRMVRSGPEHPLIGRYVIDLQRQRREGPQACREPEVKLLRTMRPKPRRETA